MQVLFSLLTIAILISLGFLARKLSILSKEHTKGLSSFVYYFALPALFFVKIANLDLWDFNKSFLVIFASLLPTLIITAFLFIIYVFKLIRKDTFVLLCLSIVFGSHVFFGIAFFEASFGNSGLDFAILTSSYLGPIGIISSIFLFEFASNKSESGKFILRVFTNPLIIAICIGLAFSILNIHIQHLFNSLEMVGRTAGPLAIFILGMFIYNNFSFIALKRSFNYSCFRLTVLPIVTYFVLMLFDIQYDLKHFLFMQSGIPVATSLAIYSERFNYKNAEISGMVIATSLGSFPVLFLLQYLR
ncbi:MAG: AEC family transporter [Desulforhopalus sp.]